MDLADLQLNRQLYRTQPQTPETLGAGEVASNLSPAPSTAIASGNSVTDVNTNAETINGSAITPGTIPPSTLNIANWGWTQTCAFSVSDADTVAWGSGTFTSANGEVYSITGSNTGNMVARTYIYLDINVSVTAYQMSTSVTAPIGVGKVFIAVCENGSPTATYNLVQAHQIVGDNVLANTLNANRIVAGSITATQISASYVYAGTITANQVTAGTLTGSIVQTSSGSTRVVMDSGSNTLQIYNSNVVRMYLFEDALSFQNASGVLVGFLSSSGTNLLMDANSLAGGTVYLNGNSTGSVRMLINSVPRFVVESGTITFSADMIPLTDNSYQIGDSSNGLSAVYSDVFLAQNVQQPVLYYGYCSGTTISKNNNSFTLANPTTGNYTITHNFGTTNYTVVATALRGSGAGAYSAKITTLNSNTFQVTVFDDTGSAVNSDFMFLVTKIP